jgi:hypothetical protein
MLLAEEGTFVHSLLRSPDGSTQPRGTSPRYGSIVLLGVRHLPEPVQRELLGGASAAEFAGRLLDQARGWTNLGDLALLSWATAELDHPDLERALGLLLPCMDAETDSATVEAAWTVSALVAARENPQARAAIDRARAKLFRAFRPASGLFAHHTHAGHGGWLRAHVACFADLVYPIQACARLHAALGDEQSLAAANATAAVACRTQGPGGQWWWHYDVRNGSIVEGYPVYSVHQDSMAPMALFDLVEAGGDDHGHAVARGLPWLMKSAELGTSLIDEEPGMIWRKIARTDGGKTARAVRAATSRLSPGWRLGFLDGIWQPRRVDWECRPYHLGWVLDCWLGGM